MNGHDKLQLIGLVLFSLLTSFLCTFYGLNILLAENVSRAVSIFAYVTAGYGAGNLYVLSWAWRGGSTWAVEANKVMGLCFLGVFIMDRVRGGDLNGVGVASIMIATIMVGVNWQAVKKVVEVKGGG
ncbi:MAG: hypothetical protein OET90_02950 [Desulfuromonadales bacterium]|nr:hypothetical protein [Desulfuromonadales bacterium]